MLSVPLKYAAMTWAGRPATEASEKVGRKMGMRSFVRQLNRHGEPSHYKKGNSLRLDSFDSPKDFGQHGF